MTPKICIYRRDDTDGHIRLCATFSTLEDLFRATQGRGWSYRSYRGADRFDGFSSDFNERFNGLLYEFDKTRRFHDINGKFYSWEKETHYCYLCYDEYGQRHYSHADLVGLYRKWRDNTRTPWYWWRHSGSRRAWRGWRHPRTTQELRWSKAWDDEEFAPTVRACRRGHNLPSCWDDMSAHNDKCWKTQSKRRHQWKEK